MSLRSRTLICIAVAAGVFAALYISVKFLFHGDEVSGDLEKAELVEVSSKYALFRPVPSDALCVSCPEGVKSKVVSTHFLGSLVELQIFDAGRSSEEPSASVQSLLDTLKADRYASVYLPAPKVPGRNMVLASKSQSLVASSQRHYEEGTSILDSPLFESALSKAASHDSFRIIRTKDIKRLLPTEFLSEFFSRRELLSFLESLSQWIVVAHDGERCTAATVQSSDFSWYANLIQSNPAGECRVANVAPASSECIIDLPVANMGEFLSLRDKNLDADAKLQKHSNNLKTLKKYSGIDPVKWAESLGICEVARIKFDAGEILAFRSSRPEKSDGIQPFAYQGFLKELFANVFGLPDESSFYTKGKWTFVGSQAALQQLAQEDAGEAEILQMCPTKKTKLVFATRPCKVFWTSRSIELDV